jgi:hypothetical protein
MNGGRRFSNRLKGLTCVGEVQKGDVMDGPRKYSFGENGAVFHVRCIIDGDVW